MQFCLVITSTVCTYNCSKFGNFIIGGLFRLFYMSLKASDMHPSCTYHSRKPERGRLVRRHGRTTKMDPNSCRLCMHDCEHEDTDGRMWRRKRRTVKGAEEEERRKEENELGSWDKRRERRKCTWKGRGKRKIRRNMKRRKIKLVGRRRRKEVEEEEEAYVGLYRMSA